MLLMIVVSHCKAVSYITMSAWKYQNLTTNISAHTSAIQLHKQERVQCTSAVAAKVRRHLNQLDAYDM